MLTGDDDYKGMVSWTGTMFEYFMPNLLLPVEPNSLVYESLAFCLYEQRKRGRRTGTPWGISESCFYAFDPGLSYQYKAHGVQRLGLKRGLDEELVVAPYASFLALLLSPRRRRTTCAACARWGRRGNTACTRRWTSPLPGVPARPPSSRCRPLWPTIWA